MTDNTITYSACATQICFVIVFGVARSFLLIARSHDHFVTICKPLHYGTIMNQRVCTPYPRLLADLFIAHVHSILCGLSGRILWLHYDWSFWLWCISSPGNFMLGYTVHRENNHYLCFTRIDHNPHSCGAILYLHHQDYLKISFCSTRGEKAFSTCSSCIIAISVTMAA